MESSFAPHPLCNVFLFSLLSPPSILKNSLYVLFSHFSHQINLNNYLPPNFCPDIYAQTSFLSSVDLKSPHSLMCPKSFDLKYLPTLVTPSFFKFFSLLPSWLHSPYTPPSYLNMSLFSTEVLLPSPKDDETSLPRSWSSVLSFC